MRVPRVVIIALGFTALVSAGAGSRGQVPAEGPVEAPAAAPQVSPQWVIPPGSEAGLRKALEDGGAALPGGWKWVSAEVNNDRVQVRFERRSGEGTVVTLVRQSKATEAAVVVPGGALLAIEPTPGPCPPGFPEALAKRLEAAEVKIPWKQVGDGAADAPIPEPAPPESPPDLDQTDDADEGSRVLGLGKRVEHLLQRGNQPAARDLLAAFDDTAIVSPASRGELAVIHGLVGDADGARKIAEEISGTRSEWLAQAAADPTQITGEILADRSPDDVCEMVSVGHALNRLGKAAQAEAFLRDILKASPKCREAVVRLALTLIDQRRGEEALDVVTPAFDADPDNPELMMVKCSALRLLARLPEAIALVEQLVRSGRHQPGDLGMLLAMYLREQELGRHIDHWKQWASRHPEDLVAPFMVGVLLHYGNDFEESDQWLKPLRGRLENEPRLFVYTAMNAFNLGRVEESRALLDQAAELPIVDPDVYYCRAEITRDTERELAISDLQSYLALTEGTPHASDSKQARVRDMLAELIDCHERNLPQCGGPWEHPRRPWWHPDRGYIEVILLVLFGLAFIGFRFRGRSGRVPS